MRFLYAVISVISGVLSLAVTYLFFTFVMFMGGGTGALQSFVFYVVGCFLLAALLNLAAGFVNPRKSAARRVLLVSAAIWPLGGALIGVTKYFDADGVSLASTLAFVALIAAPAVLPLMALAFACWKFPRV